MTDETEKDTPETNQEGGTPESHKGENPEKSKEWSSILAQKDHFRTKAEELELENKKLKDQLSSPVSTKQNPDGNIDPLEMVRLAKVLGGYDEDETSFILRNAKDKSPMGIVEASKDEWVQEAIQAKRAKVIREQKVPEPTSASGTVRAAQDTAKELIAQGKFQEAGELIAKSLEKSGSSET